MLALLCRCALHGAVSILWPWSLLRSFAPFEDFPIQAQSERFLRLAEQGKPYDLLDDMLALSCRAEAIAAFLAVLELSRLQLIRLHQTSTGDLLFYRTTRQVGVEELRSIPR